MKQEKPKPVEPIAYKSIKLIISQKQVPIKFIEENFENVDFFNFKIMVNESFGFSSQNITPCYFSHWQTEWKICFFFSTLPEEEKSRHICPLLLLLFIYPKKKHFKNKEYNMCHFPNIYPYFKENKIMREKKYIYANVLFFFYFCFFLYFILLYIAIKNDLNVNTMKVKPLYQKEFNNSFSFLNFYSINYSVHKITLSYNSFLVNLTNYSKNDDEILRFSIICLKNVIVNSMTVFYENSTLFFPFSSIQKKIPLNYNYWITNEVDQLILFNHAGILVYGHFFIDFLSSLLFFNKSLIENSLFLIFRNPPPYFYEGLDIFGIKKKNIIIQNEFNFYFVKKCYTIDPLPHYLNSTFCFQILSNKFREYFHLKYDIPNRIFLYKRSHGSRQIENFELILSNLSLSFPKYNFEIFPFLRTLQESAYLANQAKIYFIGFHGSAFANLFFMQKNTYFIEIKTSLQTNITLCITKSLSINYLFSILPKINHFSKNQIILDINLVFNLFFKILT